MEHQPADLREDLLDRKEQPGQSSELGGLRWTGVGLKVQGGTNEILRDCYGQVRRGELLGIVGSSGSGKTSLLNLLAFRLDDQAATIGSITFDSKEVKSRSAMKKLSSFVNQTDTFHPNLTPRSRPA